MSGGTNESNFTHQFEYIYQIIHPYRFSN